MPTKRSTQEASRWDAPIKFITIVYNLFELKARFNSLHSFTIHPVGRITGRTRLKFITIVYNWFEWKVRFKICCIVYHSSRRDGSRAKRLMILGLFLRKRSSRKTFAN